MAPKSSSASAATRKKHAKKSDQSSAQKASQVPAQPKQKKDKKAPKIKRFIPPPTYQGELDPVDTLKLGLHGSPVKPERAVILRKLGKKDPTTVERGLDEWIHWINTTFDQTSTHLDEFDIDSDECDELGATVPVLIHHFPRLVVHPSRRVRLLSLTLFEMFATFHHVPKISCRSLLLNPVDLERPEYIGSWIISLWDPDKTARTIATKVWSELVDLNVEEQTQVPDKFKLVDYDSEIIQHLVNLIQVPELKNSQELGPSSSVPRKVAELSESQASTSCRLRASAFEALAYLLHIHPVPQNLFDSIINSSVGQTQIWEGIMSSQNPEPLVRKAMWKLIHTLSTQELCKPLLDSLLPIISFPALRAAFTEHDLGVQGTMITGLITLLRIYPQLWWSTSSSTLCQSPNPYGNQVTDETPNQHLIIDTFYEFLEFGCSGNPTLLYPALILVVTSFPITIDSAEQFFSHFWAPLDTRTLRSSGMKGLIEFSRSWSECLQFFAKKLGQQATPLYQRELTKLWSQIGQHKSPSDDGFQALSGALIKVIHQSSIASDYAWPMIETTILEEHQAGKALQYLRFLSYAHVTHTEESLGKKAQKLSLSLSHRALNRLKELPDAQNQIAWIPVLTHILKEESAGRQLIDEPSLAVLLEFCRGHLQEALWSGSKPHYDLFLNILQAQIYPVSNIAWLTLMSLNEFDAEFVTSKQSIICGIFSHVTKCKTDIPLPNLGIDQFVSKCLEQLLRGNTKFRVLIEPTLIHPKLFIKEETIVDMLAIISQALHDQINLLPHNLSSFNSTKLRIILPTCQLQIQHLGVITPARLSSVEATLNQLVIDLFVAELFLELLADESAVELVKTARDTRLLTLQLCNPRPPELYRPILQLLCDCVTDVECRIHPFDLINILKLFLQQHGQLETLDFLSLLPIGNISDDLLTSLLTPKKFTPLLCIIDGLIQSTSAGDDEVNVNLNAKYDRIVLAVLHLFIQDRKLVQSHLWLWTHCMYIGELARYTSSVTTSIVDTDNVLHQEELLAIVSAVDTNTTFFVSSLATNVTTSWHSDMIMKMTQPENHLSSETDPLKSLILSLVIGTRREASRNLATVAFRRVLSHLFKYSDTSANDFEKWLTFLQQMPSSQNNLCLSLIQSLKTYLFGNENFQKYQNRLASNLIDVPSTKANVNGLQLMELLCATAPPPDSLHVFLPQRRVIFLLQTISGWLQSDDELENSLNNKLLELFSYFAPIVQTVMGSHWEQIMDLIAINLEEASWEDESSLLLIWRSCLLMKALLNILRHNHALQSEIGSQVHDCVKLLLKLFCSAPFQLVMPVTSVTLLHVMEDVLRDGNVQSLYLESPNPLLVNSIYSPSISTGVLGLTILQAAVKHLTDKLVIEYELKSDTSNPPSLPEEILNVMRRTNGSDPTRALMIWILVFSYFHNASLRLKNYYSSQLRDANVVSENLIPLLHQVLQVSERGKPIDISIWDITSFDLSLLEDDRLKPVPLAAYVYFLALRTVPAQIRCWWEDCRNKQLSMSVGGFISRNFSPLLINQELDKLKDPDILKSLTDENLLIKVSPVIKEVKVIYTVDDESMEIVIRIPSDYPLQSVEVLDVRKVGIPDTTWRAWLFVVQQSITNHNGSIADAVVLFKKNISLHFEGVEACAICYAIISVVDRSLPSKACRTCRNRFHPSCLYKWFSTSHGSSCPLCRSLF